MVRRVDCSDNVTVAVLKHEGILWNLIVATIACDVSTWDST